MIKIWLFLVFLCCVSCARIQYRSSGEIPVSLTQQKNDVTKFLVEGKAHFYFWGRYPKENIVLIDQLAQKQGFLSLSRLTITEYDSFMDYFWSILSLGTFTPRSYRLEGYGGLQ